MHRSIPIAAPTLGNVVLETSVVHLRLNNFVKGLTPLSINGKRKVLYRPTKDRHEHTESEDPMQRLSFLPPKRAYLNVNVESHGKRGTQPAQALHSPHAVNEDAKISFACWWKEVGDQTIMDLIE